VLKQIEVPFWSRQSSRLSLCHDSTSKGLGLLARAGNSAEHTFPGRSDTGLTEFRPGWTFGF